MFSSKVISFESDVQTVTHTHILDHLLYLDQTGQ